MSKGDLEEPNPTTDQIYLGCTHGASDTHKIILKSELLNKLVSSSASTIASSNRDTKHHVIPWSDDMQGRARKGIERFYE